MSKDLFQPHNRLLDRTESPIGLGRTEEYRATIEILADPDTAWEARVQACKLGMYRLNSLPEGVEIHIPALLLQILHNPSRFSEPSLEKLAVLHTDSKATMGIIAQIIADTHRNTRSQGMKLLCAVIDPVEYTVPLAIRALEDRSRRVRFFAGLALRRIAKNCRSIPSLGSYSEKLGYLLKHGYDYQPVGAIWAMASIGSECWGNADILGRKLAATGRTGLRSASAYALGKIGRKGLPAAMPVISANYSLRLFYFGGLLASIKSRYGTESEDAQDFLIELTMQEDPKLRFKAVQSIGKIKSEQATRAARAALLDPVHFVRSAAAKALELERIEK